MHQWMSPTDASPAHLCWLTRRSRRLGIACLLIALIGIGSMPLLQAAPPQGLPLLQRFTNEQYPALPANSAVASDQLGRVYLGNAEGLLVFDGSHWELHELPRKTTVSALGLGADGQMYLGGYDLFGRINETASGELQFEDLREQFDLQGSSADVEEVWEILPTSGGVYFHAAHRLFYYGFDGRRGNWPLPDETRGFFALGDTIYLRVAGTGFCRWTGGVPVPEPGAEVFSERPLAQVFARPDGLLLVSPDGFYLANRQGIKLLDTAAEAEFTDDHPYTGLRLSDGSYAISTYGGRLLWFSTQLKLLAEYPISAYTILGMSLDREGGLWLATEGDAVRLHMPSSWTRFGPAEGLRGGINASTWYQDSLWVATSMGVLRAKRDGARTTFSEAIQTYLEAFDLKPTDHGLLVADRDGVLWLPPEGTQPVRIPFGEAAYTILPSRFDRNLSYVVGTTQIFLLRHDGAQWQIHLRWPVDGMSVSTLHETAPGTLWIGNSRGAGQRWQLDLGSGKREVRILDSQSGIKAAQQNGVSFQVLDGNIFAISGSQSWRLVGDTFVPDQPAPFDRIERHSELVITDTPAGTFAHSSRELWLRPKGQDKWQSVHLRAGLAPGFAAIEGGDDGRVRIATWAGLLQFDPAIPQSAPPPLAARLRQIESRSRKGHVELLPLNDDSEPELPPRATLRLSFGMVSLDSKPLYRYHIDGLQPQWSEWSSEDQLMLRELPAGEHVLELQARTESGREATPLQYRFSVASLWWETSWARSLALLLSLALIGLLAFAISRHRLRLLATETRRLEQHIAERTAELQIANRRLEEMATVDSLTGIANRRALEHGLAREWKHCAEKAQPISALMMDIDHFKQYNDKYGHLQGDELLRWMGAELRAQCNLARELLARFGGEEFVLLLPGLNLQQARQRAESIRSRFAKGDSQVRLSIGVAEADPLKPGDAQQLLQAADAALYRAKRAGRNRVEVAG